MAILVGDTLYFSADDASSGTELWAHDTSNASTWQVADINSGSGSSDPGQYMSILVGDTLYFSAYDGSSGTNCGLMIPQTPQLGGWLISTAGVAAVTPDNTWRYSSVIRSTSVRMMEAAAQNCGLMIPQTPQLGGWLISTAGLPAVTPEITWRYSSVIRSTSVRMMEAAAAELWAHDTSNASTWRVADIHSGVWRAVTPDNTWRYSSVIRSTSVRMMEAAATNCGLMIPQTPQLGGWLISTAELAAVTPDITWRYSSVIRSTSVRMMEAAATNCGLMIPQTPQLGGWLISTAASGGSNPGYYMEILVGDTLYFSADDGSSGHELWAHDTSNASTWRVADIYSGTGSSNPGQYMSILVGDTLYFDADDGSSG